MEVFELSTDVTNVHKWSYLEGCREFIQGFLDNQNGGTWYYEDETLTLISKDTQLSRKVFLAGYSTKREEKESRGKFGDGLTSGICCLLREGHIISIQNGCINWKPTLGKSSVFDHEVVMIEESEGDELNEDYIVKIGNITQEQLAKVVDNTLQMQDNIFNGHKTPEGDILLDEQHKGKIFCGGLFVDYFKSDYGFDFKPSAFELDRDRKSLKPFDIKWQTKEIWKYVTKSADANTADNIIEGMDKGESSLEYINHTYTTNSSNLINSAEKLYKEKYDGKILTTDYKEAEDLRKLGNKVEVVKNEGLVNIVKQTNIYKNFSLSTVKVKSVSELLTGWLDDWQDEIPVEAYDDFVEMEQEINNK